MNRVRQIGLPLVIMALVMASGLYAPTALASTAPAAPTGLTITVEANGADLDVMFTGNSNATYYEFELHRSATQSGSYSAIDTKGTTTSPADFDAHEQGYWYKARGRSCKTASSAATCSSWTRLSSAVEIDIPTQAPPRPTGLRVTSTNESEVNLSWTSLSNASHYMVERSESIDGPWVHAFYELSARTSYKAVGLKCNTPYYFRIRARGDGSPYTTDYGEPSVGPVSGTTKVCTNSDTVDPPTGLSATTTADTVRLSWNKATNAVGYVAERGATRDGPWGTVRFQITSTARNDHVGLECDTTYYYRVRAKGNGKTKSRHYGEPSTVISATTKSCVPSDSPALEILTVPNSLVEGRNQAFAVSASNLNASTRYTISLTVTDDLAFDSECSVRTKTETVTSGSKSFNFYPRLYGCDVSGGTLTGKLMSGTTEVYSPESIKVPVTKAVTITADDDLLWLGQPVTVTAYSPSTTPYSAVSSYQFQERKLSGWTDIETASSLRSRVVPSHLPGERTYRVLVAYRNGETHASDAVKVTWTPVTVSVSTSTSYPTTTNAATRRVTLTAKAEGPETGMTYQWYRDTGSGMSRWGTASSSRTKTAVFSSQGTRSFRVEALHSTTSTTTSKDVFVTWDQNKILTSLMTKLETNVKKVAAYKTAERNLLSCMNSSSDAGGAGRFRGSSGNATSTPPLPPDGGVGGAAGDTPSNPQYGSFSDILANYTGNAGKKLDGTCSLYATAMFNEIESLVPKELNRLKSTDTDYADLLNIPARNAVLKKAGRSELVKLYSGVLSYEVEEPDDSSEDGVRGANGGGGVSTDQGFDCMPDLNAEPDTLGGKVDVVNCLVFGTPHDWWETYANELKRRIDYSYRTTDRRLAERIYWLGYGDWECTDPAPEGPVVSCKKHDVAFDSLQKFSGRNSENLQGGTPIGEELDQTWHPRNKSLADSKFFADIDKHGCQQQSGAPAWVMCGSLSNWAIAVIFHFFVADWNDKGWPVTDEDLEAGGGPKEETDAESSEYDFVVCGNPVPRIANLSIKQVVGVGFDATWNFEEGCVENIAISNIEICLILNAGASTLKPCQRGLSTTDTSRRFPVIRTWSNTHWPIIGVEVRISPTNVSYGPDHYKQYWRRYPVRVQ